MVVIYSISHMKERVKHIVGIDEVGRGPLAGPVTICALAVRAEFDLSFFKGIRDSKKLSEKQRKEWLKKIKDKKVSGELHYFISSVGAEIIDRRGISWAVRRAIKNVIGKLPINPDESEVLLDGSLKAPKNFKNQKTIIRGDEKIPIISASSIVAKVFRDKKMSRLHKRYPQYGFHIHKGYGTSAHYKALKKHGLSPIHRRSFLKGFK